MVTNNKLKFCITQLIDKSENHNLIGHLISFTNNFYKYDISIPEFFIFNIKIK